MVNCVTSSDIAEDLHLAGSVTGKLAVELLHVRFSLHISLNDLQELTGHGFNSCEGHDPFCYHVICVQQSRV